MRAGQRFRLGVSAWIQAGCLWSVLLPGSPASELGFTDSDRRYWALQPVERPATPSVSAREWVRNPIDAFVLDRLEKKGIAPSPEADRVALLRRVSHDLTGLPPTPEQAENFLLDAAPGAYERLVDRLLASPAYGERWARHWLDVARYAESDGFRADETRPNVWRYRDYVVDSFNQDKPYDRFVMEQIAGDELWPDDPAALVATGFNRHYPDEWNARDLAKRRQEILQNVTDVVGSAFLGLTFACAKCHDHKFDPILQRDYYRLQAFFAHTANQDHVALPVPKETAGVENEKWRRATAEIRAEMDDLLAKGAAFVTEDEFHKFPDEVQAAVAKPAEERTPFETQLAHRAEVITKPSKFLSRLRFTEEQKARWSELEQALARHEHLRGEARPLATVMRDLGRRAPPTRVLAVGNYAAPQEEVQPGFLSVLDPAPAEITPPAGLDSTGRRSALARWIASPENPLTARVIVNRLWHWHFGRGIVATPGDFGRMGERPTHPELLDWLADELIRNGWRLKPVHRLIVLSNAYRQSSDFRAEAAAVDPFNRLLWRRNPRRLEAEAIRDSALAVAGLLNPSVGGPSFFPPLPDEMPSPAGGWEVSDDPAERNRRSLYIFAKRGAPFPMLKLFDAPHAPEPHDARNVTTTAPQALALLNAEESLRWARAFAGRALASGAGRSSWISTVFQLAYNRDPSAWEAARAATFLDRQSGDIAARAASGEPVEAPPTGDSDTEPSEAAALVDLCLAVLSSNEFVYRF